MNNPISRNYRPKNYSELVARFRKVIPPQPTGDPEALRRVPAVPRNLATGLSPYTGEWTEKQAAHLLKRALFGVKRSELSLAMDLGMSVTVSTLLEVGQAPLPPVNDYNSIAEGIEDPDVAFGETWIEAPHGDDLEGSRVASLKGWMVKNRIKQGFSLEEKMILFWHNLLPAEMWAVFVARLSYHYEEMLRRNVFGNYKALIRELTLDPSMLLYLNGAFNNKYAPDENYGRELQELFCIGKGPGSQYTEEDVQAAARVLTGFTLKWEDIEAAGNVSSIFYPDYHDTSDKQFSTFYGSRLITGKSGPAGAGELDELLEIIFENEEVSKYICRRLYNFFVYPVIDASAEEQIIAPLAALFRASNYEIKPVIAALLQSEHFYDEANIGAMIKSPADALIGLWRTLDIQDVSDSDIHLLAKQHLSMIWTMANWGMELGDPPSVAGWPAYYQAPQFDKAWITTDTITNRAFINDSLIFWGFWINEDNRQTADLIHFLETLQRPEDPTLMLRESAQLLLGIQPSDESIQGLKAILLSGQSTDGYWTTAWLQYQSNPTDMEYKLTLINRLKPTFQRLLQLAEAQLM